MSSRASDLTPDDADDALRAFYELEAAHGSRGPAQGFRVGLRDDFVALMAREKRRSVIDVGAGPGTDTVELGAFGAHSWGVDLAVANAVRARDVAGGRVVPASMFDLPFPDGCFDASWSMSTLMHVSADRVGAVLGEMMRVLRPGALCGVGVWGGTLGDIVSTYQPDKRAEPRPPRLFSLRTHEHNRELFERHGSVERFDHIDAGPHGWDYQFAILRCPS